MPELELELKQLIIDTLMLDTQAPLFIEGLGLDSIDALELGVALQKKYGVQISANSEDTQKHFTSISTLAQMVHDTRTI
jgi:acyl carrier protein